ncbi:MAG: DUF2490 domain-containing protein [Bacteroidia bacterium]|nr:DUF2490 domain-containing protein [Bacteroidia bacterium]MDW8301149.1 DUF2490 domain-containing protein [Bacteroidia bacterium]
MLSRFIILIVALFELFRLHAQNTAPRLNNLMWYSFISVISYRQWYWQAEIHERHLLEPVLQHQFLLRYALYRKLGPDWATCAGISYLAHNTFRSQILQGIFPHVEVEHQERIRQVNVTHNYRFELRFFDDGNIPNASIQRQFYYHNVRIRYRLQVSFPLFEITHEKTVRLRIFDELHLNLGSKLPINGFHHNRLYVGLNIPTTKQLSMGIGFMYWLQQSGNQVFTNRNIYWITLTHRWSKG